MSFRDHFYLSHENIVLMGNRSFTETYRSQVEPYEKMLPQADNWWTIQTEISPNMLWYMIYDPWSAQSKG